MPQTKTGLGTKHVAPHKSERRVRALILGGTGEARRLAERLAGEPSVEAVLSLAGRTSAPREQSLPTRVGGFGGVEGLMRYLVEERIDKVVDATHPFAARISANARAACAALGLPLLTLTRAPWRREEGDRWIEVADNAAAAAALGAVPRRAFLTIGRLGVADYLIAPQHHYLIRTIERPSAADLPAGCELILDRGPFTVETELSLMRAARIDALVTKNSGGDQTYAKIAAARALAIDVVMIAPPVSGEARVVHDIEAARDFLVEVLR
jgi:precorrin-6A/cobalt-precorrin-6A reductase